jgi:hypothetical protein
LLAPLSLANIPTGFRRKKGKSKRAYERRNALALLVDVVR